MRTIRLRLRAAALCVWLLAVSASEARTRPATLDDVLSMQTFGTASLSPDRRWLVYERQGAYDASPRFDFGARSGWATTSLHRVRVNDGVSEPLFRQAAGAAYFLGPWAPDGRRLVVYRLQGDRFEAGIVSMADGSVRWTGLVPDWPITGLGAAWIDNDRVALTTRNDGSLPLRFRFDATGEDVLSARWAATRIGRTPSRLALDASDGAMTMDDPAPVKALVVLAAPFDRPRRLFEGAVRDIEPSPDGRWIAILSSAEPAPQTWAERAVQSAVLRRTRLSFVALDTGAVTTRQPEADVAPHLLRWSDDSRRVLVWRRLTGDGWRDGALSAIGPEVGSLVYETPGLDPWGAAAQMDELHPVRADWFAGAPILYAAGVDGRFDWWQAALGRPLNLTRHLDRVPAAITGLTRDRLLLFGDRALWAVDRHGGRRRLTPAGVAADSAEQASSMMTLRSRVNGAPRRDWAPAMIGETLDLLEADGRSDWTASIPCDGQRRTLAAGPRSLAFLCLDRGVETLRLATPSGVRVVDRVNPSFADLDLPTGRPIDHHDRFGRPAHSLLFLPAGREPQDVRGVVVLVYPGALDDGQGDGLTLHMGLRPQLLTMGGYAVLSAGLPGAEVSATGAFIDDLTAGVDLAVEAMLAAEPTLARKPIAVAGHSFGGYAALATATRTPRYSAYVAWAAPTDPAGRWGEPGPGGWLYPQERLSFNEPAGGVESGQGHLGAPPWAAPDLYRSVSPALTAETITAPVLLITADRDYVPMTQSQRMFAALRRLGKPARLVTYWGEGHDNASPANIRDVYAEIFAFLQSSFDRTSIRGADGPPRPAPSPRRLRP